MVKQYPVLYHGKSTIARGYQDCNSSNEYL